MDNNIFTEKRMAEQVRANMDINIEELEIKKYDLINTFSIKLSSYISKKKLEMLHLCELSDDAWQLLELDLENPHQALNRSFSNKILQFLSESEKNFIEMKDLASLTRLNDSLEVYDAYLEAYRLFPYETKGAFDYFDGSLEKITEPYEGYKFRLPPMNSKNGALRYIGDGKFVYYAIQKLIKDYEVKHSIIRPMKSPIGIFVHHFDADKKEVTTLDADNVDTKTSTDALQGYILTDDNLLSFWTMNFGVEDTTSFCDLFLIEKEELPSWIEAHNDLFHILPEKDTQTS